ncbi:MAG: molybdopterin-dependent oxidoreductase [Candidatus Sumerlaeia bacterium]|nr:molybdopterin-dependent oxidoreductase [Candidatus Sumerlaeia bacterium]
MTTETATRHIGKSISRVDGLEKTTGELKYLSDLLLENSCHGKVLRAAHPHARITRIDTAKAEALPGVVCVLTHRHVRGLNRFGIAQPDMPVLCEDKVRYVGDAVALVAAETEEIAKDALALIEVGYDVLPVVDDPERALEPGAPPVHAKGNLLHENGVAKGDVARGFAESDVVIGHRFRTQMYAHAFLEIEAGTAIHDEKTGVITVWCAGQYPYRDQLQIARALGWDPEKVHVIASPIGGAFGGKDEITIQIYLALLALHTQGRPVRLQLTREESMEAGTKRHPFIIDFKAGAAKDGTFKALEVEMVSDAGAYATLSGPVMNLAIEGASGPYLWPHTKIHGRAAYTNNGFSGAFRGFGTTQSCYAGEQIFDMIAGQLGMDPIDLRLKNALRRGDISAMNHEIWTSVGIRETLLVAKESRLWRERHARRGEFAPPLFYGVGVASEFQATGLGKGIPDFAGSHCDLEAGGTVVVRVGGIEMGTGVMTAYCQMAAEALGLGMEQVRIVAGDTEETPDSGTTTASRSIYMIGNAVTRAAKALRKVLEAFVAEHWGDGHTLEPGGVFRRDGVSLGLAQIAQRAASLGTRLRGEGHFVHPEADKDFGDGLPHIMYSYCTQVASVIVDAETGEVRVDEVLSIPDAGRAINPQGIEGQSDGGVVMGASYALLEEVLMKGGRFVNANFTNYTLPTAVDCPRRIDTVIVEVPEPTHEWGAKGIGETVTVPICPAICNAVYDAIGIRFFEIPITPERLTAALDANPECKAMRAMRGVGLA